MNYKQHNYKELKIWQQAALTQPKYNVRIIADLLSHLKFTMINLIF